MHVFMIEYFHTYFKQYKQEYYKEYDKASERYKELLAQKAKNMPEISVIFINI